MRHGGRHPLDSELLLAVDGELSGYRRAIIEWHVARCGACRTKIETLHRTLIHACEAWRAPGDANDEDHAHRRARARLAHALGQEAQGWRRSWPVRARVLAPTAAGVVMALLLISSVLVWQAQTGEPRVADPGLAAAAPLPVPSLTPGAVTLVSAAELCNGTHPSPVVDDRVRLSVLHAYGMERVPADQYELDALITPELGGSTDARNLWPQRYSSTIWNARVKDELERLLPRLVCSGQLDLGVAQRDMATDWIAAYKKYFNTAHPLQAHLAPAAEDHDDLESAPPPHGTELAPIVSIGLFTRL